MSSPCGRDPDAEYLLVFFLWIISLIYIHQEPCKQGQGDFNTARYFSCSGAASTDASSVFALFNFCCRVFEFQRFLRSLSEWPGITAESGDCETKKQLIEDNHKKIIVQQISHHPPDEILVHWLPNSACNRQMCSSSSSVHWPFFPSGFKLLL